MKPLDFAVKEYWVYTLGYKKMADIKCRDAWANKHFAGDTTVEHSHQDGWWGSCQISCVYYFRKPRSYFTPYGNKSPCAFTFRSWLRSIIW